MELLTGKNMSVLDEHIEIPFEKLLLSLGWLQVWDRNYFSYHGHDAESRYYSIYFYPKGTCLTYADTGHRKHGSRVLRKDLWVVQYQPKCNSFGLPWYSTDMKYIRMQREDICMLMNDLTKRTFNPKNYKCIKLRC
jgi:hypothetical protein